MSMRAISLIVAFQTFRSTPADFMKSLSWATMTSPSAVSCTSISTQSAPSSIALRTAAMVFSGRTPAAPRWAMISTVRGELIRASKPSVRNSPAATQADAGARITQRGTRRPELTSAVPRQGETFLSRHLQEFRQQEPRQGTVRQRRDDGIHQPQTSRRKNVIRQSAVSCHPEAKEPTDHGPK